jgi:hypothetical protein
MPLSFVAAILQNIHPPSAPFATNQARVAPFGTNLRVGGGGGAMLASYDGERNSEGVEDREVVFYW